LRQLLLSNENSAQFLPLEFSLLECMRGKYTQLFAESLEFLLTGNTMKIFFFKKDKALDENNY